MDIQKTKKNITIRNQCYMMDFQNYLIQSLQRFIQIIESLNS